ncbi:MAG: family 16 glycoside hydrolase, partial [Rubripirellula sp.]
MQPLLSITAIILFLPDAIASAETTSKPLFNGQQSRQELQQQGFTPLFDDGSMEKWKLEEWHRGHWEAKGNILAYDGQARHSGKRRADLWTKNDYGDCVVYAEWRLPMEPRLKPHPVVLYNGDFLMQEGNPK